MSNVYLVTHKVCRGSNKSSVQYNTSRIFLSLEWQSIFLCLQWNTRASATVAASQLKFLIIICLTSRILSISDTEKIWKRLEI